LTDIDNVFDLDFSGWTGAELREYRKELWVTREELRSHPLSADIFPSCPDMAARIGVNARTWQQWEREGVPSTGWSALLRIYRDESRDISPINCSLDALDAVSELLDGNYSELARALNVDRRAITYWRYAIGYVPGVLGYGRLVRIIFEDLVLPVRERK